jgi:hypothetical protein
MFRRAPWAVLPILAAGWLAAAAPAPAAPAVTDEAGFFTPEAVQKAEDGIKEIREAYHKDLVIETYKAVPEDKVKEVRNMTPRARELFFQQWAEERARERNVDGIYVLLCRNPAYTQVVLGPNIDDSVFPEKDRNELAKKFAPRWGRRNYDAQLLEAVTYARYRLHVNLVEGGTPSSFWTWLGSLIAILVLLVVWLVVLVLRAAVAFWHHQSAEGPGAESGSGAFVGGILGGTVGGRAGHWLWESLSGPRRGVPAGAPRRTPLTGREGDDGPSAANDWEDDGALAPAEEHRADGERIDPRPGDANN